MTDKSSMRRGTSTRSGVRWAGGGEVRQTNPWAVVDAFQELEAGDTSFYQNKLPELDLPGHGELDEDCGDEIPRFCDCCGAITNVGRTCRRSVCPRCWRSWARVRASTIGSKLEGLRRYVHAERGQSPKFHHLALSPPDGFRVNREDPLDAAYEILKDVLEDLGAETGVIVYHPYRAEEEGEREDNRGVWKDILPSADEQRDMAVTREAMEDDSAHFHAVVVADFIDGSNVTKVVEEQTGWLIKRITQKSNENVSIYGQHDLARVLTYVLSHTGIDTSGDRNRAAYRYFGRVANFQAVEEIEDEFDEIVRSVAPRTLGLKYDSLACLETRAKDVDGGNVDPRAAEAARSPGPSSSGTLDDASASSSTSTSGAEGTAVVEYELEDACKGRLLDIKEAPKYLEDAEWRADAAHLDELQTTWDEWRARIDDDPPPD